MSNRSVQTAAARTDGHLLSPSPVAAEWTPAAKVPVAIPAVSHLREWTNEQPGLLLVSEFHERTPRNTWSRIESSLIVSKRRTVYLTCNYLRAGESRKVTIECEGSLQSITIEHACGSYAVEIGKDRPALVNFCADGELIPLKAGLNPDPRALSFELWFAMPENLYVVNMAEEPQARPTLYCVYNSKKELDSLQPIYKALRARGFVTELLGVNEAINRFKASGFAKGFFLITEVYVYSRLFNAGCRGQFLYTEHGASPLKVYTYDRHYERYDLVLLPGDLWVERAQKLYPSLAGRCHSVGYAKVQDMAPVSAEERAALCARFGLDVSKPLVLFAPSWSGGMRDRGIFNVACFEPSMNVLAIPHDGDREHVAGLREAGHNIHVLDKSETISEFYRYADVLVSDVSSTAVEFAALGKPTLCLQLDKIPHFEPKFHEAPDRIRVPHTDRYWDFCPLLTRAELNPALTALLAQTPEQSAAHLHAANVQDFIRCTGSESVELNVKAITEFLAVRGIVAGEAQ